jgi:hypothetical protein
VILVEETPMVRIKRRFQDDWKPGTIPPCWCALCGRKYGFAGQQEPGHGTELRCPYCKYLLFPIMGEYSK